MYVFMHERCQLYDLKIKWSSERETIPLKNSKLLLLFWSLSKKNNICENNEPYLSVQLAKKKKYDMYISRLSIVLSKRFESLVKKIKLDLQN